MFIAFAIVMVLMVLYWTLICNEGYIMTLGNYLYPSPIECNEIVPRDGVCNSCSLQCGEHKYNKYCNLCKKKL